MRALTLAPRLRRSRGYVWGFVDQALSSATNFGLFLIAGRQLGPHGLGVVTISVSAYLFALGFQRSLLAAPLVSASAALKIEDRLSAIRKGSTIGLVGALGATLLLLVLGLVIPGNIGRSFLIIAPWLLPALIQDFWRAVLFQERRAKAAVANDATWALFMGLTVPLAWFFATDWAIIGCWGVGALAGAILGFAQTRAQPISISVAFSWWKTDLWPFGRWLGSESVIYAVTTFGTVFVLTGLLGASDLGGLRAAQSIFAPLSLILPAISLPGLPAMARALTASSGAAIRLAAVLSGLVGALAALYVGAMVLLGGRLIPYVFGSSFAGFANLAGPIGTWQLVSGLSAGFGIFLVAQQRGRDILVSRGTGALASIAFISLLAWTSGVVGAAWGFALGAGCGTALTVVLAVRSYERATDDQARHPAEEGIADA